MMMKQWQFLKKVSIFSDCTDGELAEVVRYLKEKQVPGANVLFSEGDEGTELFIVKEGTVKSLIRTVDGSEKELAVFGEGDYFGEMSIIDNAPRSATCRVEIPAVLFSMEERGFYELMEARPRTAIKIMYKMLNVTTQRLTKTSRFVSDMVRWGNAASRRAITDEVTGAYNRRYLDRVLAECHAAARASGKTYSLAMMDLDRFREINEAYGHETGNKLLVGVVEVIKRSLGPSDALARYGGDEFTILFPDTTLAGAVERAERIRSDIEALRVPVGEGGTKLTVSASLGIANFPETAADPETIGRQADRALYQAKEDGRNRVVPASAL